MSQTIHLSIDVMGGDQGPHLAVPASLSFLDSHPDVELTFVGDENVIKSLLPARLVNPNTLTPLPDSRIRILATAESVTSQDKPSALLRRGENTSLWQALQLVAEGKADGCLSAGDSGALMALGRHLLGVREGFERPAICKAMPASGGVCHMLDLGANIQCSADLLAQFARLGVEAANVHGVKRPKLGLLNIGTEKQKGGGVLHEAAAAIAEMPGCDFVGFVEADKIYSGCIDVVVCDGFSGNVALKASEGVVRYLRRELAAWFTQTSFRKCLVFLFRPAIQKLRSRFNPDRYNGAIFAGLKGLVVKSHGGASISGYQYALGVARTYAKSYSELEGAPGSSGGS